MYEMYDIVEKVTMSEKMKIEDLFFGSVTVGDRGQIVIPAEARAQFDIKPGDKLLVGQDPMHKCLTIGKLQNMPAVLEQYRAAFERFANEAPLEEGQ